MEEEGDWREEGEQALREENVEEPITAKQSIGLLVGGITLTMLGIAWFYAALPFLPWTLGYGLIWTGVPVLVLAMGIYLLVAWWREVRP